MKIILNNEREREVIPCNRNAALEILRYLYDDLTEINWRNRSATAIDTLIKK